MQKNKHPVYQEVLFEDSSTGRRYVICSTLTPKAKMTFEGKEYPFEKLSTTAYSHPYYQGREGSADTEGRIEKFRNKYKKGV